MTCKDKCERDALKKELEAFKKFGTPSQFAHWIEVAKLESKDKLAAEAKLEAAEKQNELIAELRIKDCERAEAAEKELAAERIESKTLQTTLYSSLRKSKELLALNASLQEAIVEEHNSEHLSPGQSCPINEALSQSPSSALSLWEGRVRDARAEALLNAAFSGKFKGAEAAILQRMADDANPTPQEKPNE